MSDAENFLLRTNFRDSNAASDASQFLPSILADDDVDMMDSVVMIVMLMLGGYCRIVQVAD